MKGLISDTWDMPLYTILNMSETLELVSRHLRDFDLTFTH